MKRERLLRHLWENPQSGRSEAVAPRRNPPMLQASGRKRIKDRPLLRFKPIPADRLLSHAAVRSRVNQSPRETALGPDRSDCFPMKIRDGGVDEPPASGFEMDGLKPC